jgi:hypothetical protein
MFLTFILDVVLVPFSMYHYFLVFSNQTTLEVSLCVLVRVLHVIDCEAYIDSMPFIAPNGRPINIIVDVVSTHLTFAETSELF